MIDRLSHGDGRFTPDLTYASEHEKDLLIALGRTLKLILSADTPSVHGVAIEGTLIIVPR